AAAHAGANPRARTFLAACTIVATAALLLHIGAYLMRNPALIRIISTRASVLLLAFAVPPVIWLAWRTLSQTTSVAARFIAAYLVVWPSPVSLFAALLALPSTANAQR